MISGIEFFEFFGLGFVLGDIDTVGVFHSKDKDIIGRENQIKYLRENAEKEILGNERLLELMQDAQGLASRQVVDMLVAAVEEHRAGAEQNDDLTLLCLTISDI